MKTGVIKRSLARVMLGVVLFGTSGGLVVQADETIPEFNWVEGGGAVEIGGFSTLELDPSLLFLNQKDTQTMQDYIGNLPSDTEIGSVFPVDESQNWFVLFEYQEPGHILDKDKDKIDKDALLESYVEGTKESNKQLPEEMHMAVKGWHTEPRYDDSSNTLVWALLAENAQGEPVINYNVRILTRQGYVSTILVTDPTTLDHDIGVLNEKILPQYKIHEGSRYEDYNEATDKLAEYGLSGLILGGAGLAVAKKAGLLAAGLILLKKFWFVLLAIPVAAWNWWKRRRQSPYHTREDNETTSL